mgnify:CR=1 FL=1
MSVDVKKDPSGLFIVSIKGIFTDSDRKEMESSARAVIGRTRTIHVLLLADAFSGWSKKGDWGNLDFMNEYDPVMEKIAVVADEKWRDEMLMYLGAGLRRAAVSFFPSRSEDKARAWLQGRYES